MNSIQISLSYRDTFSRRTVCFRYDSERHWRGSLTQETVEAYEAGFWRMLERWDLQSRSFVCDLLIQAPALPHRPSWRLCRSGTDTVLFWRHAPFARLLPLVQGPLSQAGEYLLRAIPEPRCPLQALTVLF